MEPQSGLRAGFQHCFLVVMVFVVYTLQDCLAMEFLKETAYVA